MVLPSALYTPQQQRVVLLPTPAAAPSLQTDEWAPWSVTGWQLYGWGGDGPKVAEFLWGPNNSGEVGALNTSNGRKINRPRSWLYRALESLGGKRKVFLAEKLLASFRASELADSRQCPWHWHSCECPWVKTPHLSGLNLQVHKHKDHYGCYPPFPWRLASRMKKVWHLMRTLETKCFTLNHLRKLV